MSITLGRKNERRKKRRKNPLASSSFSQPLFLFISSFLHFSLLCMHTEWKKMDERNEKRRVRKGDTTTAGRGKDSGGRAGSISISDYFTSTESTPAWTMHSSTLFFVLSTLYPSALWLRLHRSSTPPSQYVSIVPRRAPCCKTRRPPPSRPRGGGERNRENARI